VSARGVKSWGRQLNREEKLRSKRLEKAHIRLKAKAYPSLRRGEKGYQKRRKKRGTRRKKRRKENLDTREHLVRCELRNIKDSEETFTSRCAKGRGEKKEPKAALVRVKQKQIETKKKQGVSERM